MLLFVFFFLKSYVTTKVREPTGHKTLQLSSLLPLSDLQAAVPAALPGTGQLPFPVPVAALVRW